MKFGLTLASTTLLGVVSLEAHAQQPAWLADRTYGQGPGIRAGNFEVHPGVAAEAGYDSNYYLRAPSEDPIGVYRLRFTPSVSLDTLGHKRLGSSAQPQLTAHIDTYAAFNLLFATESKNSDAVSNESPNTDFGANLALSLFPAARAGGDAYANFVHAEQPSNDTDTENAFNRDSFRFGAGVTWRPGGGLFDWRIGYEGLLNHFEKTNLDYLDNIQHSVNLRGRWRFLPRTSLLYDGSYTFVNYQDAGPQNDGEILRSRIGINGLITTKLSALALVGWAGTFYETQAGQPPQQFDSVTLQTELKYYLSGGQDTLNAGSAPVGLSFLNVGYTRDVSNSYLGNFYRRDRVYAGMSYLLGGAFVVNLTGGFAVLSFPESNVQATGTTGTTQAPQPAFSEDRVDVNLFTEYRLNDMFGINATFNYDQNITDTAIGSGAGADKLEFKRFQAFLGARLFW